MSRPVSPAQPDLAGILSGLKDFQRNTVDYVFRRMYEDADPARRFLVADEVGLGKTLVARGLIARVIDRLWDAKQAITILYICSNSDIARQNLQRLNVFGDADRVLPTRLTLLPSTIRGMRGNKLNFVSFTPGTSFELKNRGGKIDERILLYGLLKDIWDFGAGASPKNFFQATAKTETFRRELGRFDPGTIDGRLKSEFRVALVNDNRACRGEGRPTLKRRFARLCEGLPRARRWGNLPPDLREEISALLGEMRALLAATCVLSLKPDLVVLDEFQRFKNLLEGEDQAGELARKLFDWPEARVLLLSATPYKMYTDAQDDEDHYRDFLRTVRFLQPQPELSGAVEGLLREYRRHLYRLGQDGAGPSLANAKRELESNLKGLMARTERLAASPDRNGMLVERILPTPISDGDLRAYLALNRLIEWLGDGPEDDRLGDQIEFWKSAPYLLNFMERDDYKLKRTFAEAVGELRRGSSRARTIVDVVSRAADALLDWRSIDRYQELDPRNQRLRALIADVLVSPDCDLWRLVWLPPTAPYYSLSGQFAGLSDPSSRTRLTKRLIFSNWRVVPKAIATLLSYEVERRQFTASPSRKRRYSEPLTRRVRLMEFARSRGKLTGMPVLCLIYPCLVFAAEFDPLRLGASWLVRGAQPSLDELRAVVKAKLELQLAGLIASAEPTDSSDHNWYWAAPILLDAAQYPEATREWFARSDLAWGWKGDKGGDPDEGDDTAWEGHVDAAREVVAGRCHLGRPPLDLLDVLTELALAGPATAALRALGRTFADPDSVRAGSIRTLAGSIAWSVRRLFKLPEITAMVRDATLADDEPYWRQTLRYCLDGNIQAVLDEYVHLLCESEGLVGKDDQVKATGLASVISNVIGLRASQPHIEEVVTSDDGLVKIEPRPMRARFAMLFGEDRSEDAGVRQRRESLRAAFNSPFYPFVLATTSVGQEGLDFHSYCHAVVHWNLPSNPVDLEQREGRVHRYKGHAVRKNVATLHCAAIGRDGHADPWDAMFSAAQVANVRGTDLVPYWIYPVEGGASIERHLPLLPFSKDRQTLPELKSALTVYRMVFGQPRQDDLIEYLTQNVPRDELAQALSELVIDLSPPASRLFDPGNRAM